MSFTRRTFPEVLDSLLSDLTGGVASESHPFPPADAAAPPYRHSLQQPPAADIISLYGVRDGQSHAFRKGTDYVLLPDKQTLAWKDAQKGAQLPDPGTLFYVNYYPVAAQRTLTDLQVGSVLRTLSEAMALELAGLYAQLDVVYQSGFIDTATGSALDNVVALLGVTRVRGGRPAGEVAFTRATGSRGAINIPAGTRVMTADGKVQYETTEAVTLAPSQDTIRAVVRDLVPNDPLAAGALSVLPIPIAGIATVANPAPTALSSSDESDADLRTRAKNFLHGNERATVGALQDALAMEGITADIVEKTGVPGTIRITPRGNLTPEQQQRLMRAVDDVRPAGVLPLWAAPLPPQRLDLQIQLKTGDSLLPADRRAVQRTIADRLAGYLAKLPSGQPGTVNRVVALVSGINGVEDMQILKASVGGRDVLNQPAAGQLDLAGAPTILGDLQIADPGLPTGLDAVLTYPAAAAPADQPAIEAALKNTLAYVNDLNSTPLPAGASAAEAARRQLSFGKLLLVIPLPAAAAKPVMALADYDKASPAPALPSESTIGVYRVTFTFTQESRQAQVLAKAGDTYTLSPFERVALNSVQLPKRSGNG